MSSLYSLPIISKLKTKNLTVCTAESLTGGLLCSSLVDISGASAVIRGGIIAYSIDIKKQLLKISDDVIQGDAVNQNTAKAMAKNSALLLGADYGIATTGIAEKYDDRPCQAYVCIYNSISDNFLCSHFIFNEGENREEVRLAVVEQTLELFLSEISI